MTKAVIVLPTLDSPASGGESGPLGYGEVWYERVIDELEERGISHTVLRGNEAVKEKIEETIKKEDPELFIAYGHGLSSLEAGQYLKAEGEYDVTIAIPGTPIENWDMYTELDNADILSNRVTVFTSCNTAKELGPELIDRGTESYQGFDDEYIWVVESPETPAADGYARDFGILATEFAQSLVKGNTVKEAKEDTISKAEELIDKWEKSDDP